VPPPAAGVDAVTLDDLFRDGPVAITRFVLHLIGLMHLWSRIPLLAAIATSYNYDLAQDLMWLVYNSFRFCVIPRWTFVRVVDGFALRIVCMVNDHDRVGGLVLLDVLREASRVRQFVENFNQLTLYVTWTPVKRGVNVHACGPHVMHLITLNQP
jgi:hypothetical protein